MIVTFIASKASSSLAHATTNLLTHRAPTASRCRENFFPSQKDMSNAFISIDNVIISEMTGGYRQWYFNQHDRIIRTQIKGRKPTGANGVIPYDQPEQYAVQKSYLFATTADVLRERLDDAGYNRATLEREFAEYKDKTAALTVLPYLQDDERSASARAHTVRFATLDDWLIALSDAVNFFHRVEGCRTQDYGRHSPLINMDLLTECVIGFEYREEPDNEPRRNRLGFPCNSLECMAVAMLAVVDRHAECALDVSNFSRNGELTCFDDLAAVLKKRV